MKVTTALWSLALALLVGCFTADPYTCSSDQQCIAEGVSGQCEATGACSYADIDCRSGRRWGEFAGLHPGQCVPTTPDVASGGEQDTETWVPIGTDTALSTSSAEVPSACTPGAQLQCACPNGGQGVQRCADDGSMLDACACVGSSTTGTTSAAEGGSDSGSDSSAYETGETGDAGSSEETGSPVDSSCDTGSCQECRNCALTPLTAPCGPEFHDCADDPHCVDVFNCYFGCAATDAPCQAACTAAAEAIPAQLFALYVGCHQRSCAVSCQ